jgi:hypothetical protein
MLARRDLDPAGRIRYRATYELRSGRDYDRRLNGRKLVQIGGKLVFYGVQDSKAWDSPRPPLPALRRLRPGATAQAFRPIYSSNRIYRPLIESALTSLHVVTTCDLGRPELECTATGIIGPTAAVPHVSPTGCYAWVAEDLAHSLLYRFPLDGGEPRALRVSGVPSNEFSFLEDGGHLNVLVQTVDKACEDDAAKCDVALVRFPLASFAEQVDDVPGAAYRALPTVEGLGDFANRFVGRYVLYSASPPPPFNRFNFRTRLFAYRYAEGGDAVAVPLEHAVDRLEPIGKGVIAAGVDRVDPGGSITTLPDNLYISVVDLGDQPTVTDRHTRSRASDSSTDMFYHREDDHRGILGFSLGHETSDSDAAAVFFLQNDGLRFRELGELRVRRDERTPSYVDRPYLISWDENSRPVFLGERMLALVGDELVEGRVVQGRLEARRRLSYGLAAAEAGR